jgi:hypothetical protein
MRFYSEEATTVDVVRNGVNQIEAASQASKKTLKLNTPVSSLLQICPRSFLTAESGMNLARIRAGAKSFALGGARHVGSLRYLGRADKLAQLKAPPIRGWRRALPARQEKHRSANLLD